MLASRRHRRRAFARVIGAQTQLVKLSQRDDHRQLHRHHRVTTAAGATTITAHPLSFPFDIFTDCVPGVNGDKLKSTAECNV
jgi:hypothetical protein